MDRFIARANIDHFLDVLHDADLSAERRSVITKLLIEELNKLARDVEQLEFAQIRAAKNGVRLNHVRNMRDGLTPGSAEREDAERLFANLERIQNLLEDFCHQAHLRPNSNEL